MASLGVLSSTMYIGVSQAALYIHDQVSSNSLLVCLSRRQDIDYEPYSNQGEQRCHSDDSLRVDALELQ